jgi:UDP-GlcNAc:undecaprenyl-phosphate GlcNAc-1-phosphate transferase
MSIPRLGGIGLAVAFVAVKLTALVFFGSQWTTDHGAILVASMAMFGLGLWDDIRPLGAKRKLYGQLLIATMAYFMGLGIFHLKIPLSSHVIELGFWSWPITVLWIVGMTNLINLIDGVDGLAGGISFMLMLLLAVEGGTMSSVSFVATGMTGALLAFLRFNFPPARIYMGDGGAYFLGCLIGLLTIASSHKGTIVAALIAPLLVLALPILDTSLAIARRGFQGLPLFRADRQHIHHRLLDSGISRRKVVLGVYAFTAFFLGLGFVSFWSRGEFFSLTLGGAVLIILLIAGRLNFSREWFAVGHVLGNSLNRRAEVQYALAQTRWLAMEGTRATNLSEICEDTAFVARKLGFTSMRVRLEDGERTWQILPVNGDNESHFKYKLPGHRYCFIELSVTCPEAGNTCFVRRRPRLKGNVPYKKAKIPNATDVATVPKEDFSLLSELLAEGWAKAVGIWSKQNDMLPRLDASENISPDLTSYELVK